MRLPTVILPCERPGGRGFTLLELVVVITLIGILVGVFINRALYTMELAEKTAMEQTVGTIRMALNLRVAALVMEKRLDEISLLAKQNPMDWLAEKPKGYAGEFFDPKINEIPSGSWYYDLQDGSLVYLVSMDSHFVSPAGGRKWIRYRARLVSEPVRKGSSEIGFAGVIFAETEAYRWF
jgi:general secretion pathway protein G